MDELKVNQFIYMMLMNVQVCVEIYSMFTVK